jgi:hypothetical protein
MKISVRASTQIVNFKNNKMRKKFQIIFLLLTATVFLGKINAQTCSSNSSNSWEWMGHNNWFLPNSSVGNILNQRTGIVTEIQDPGTGFYDYISGYHGVSCASNDKGELVFFSNGIKAWRADGTVITDQLWAGTECGYQIIGSSAVHGTMTVRHPLSPDKYYIITVDDIVNQGTLRGGFDHTDNCSPPGGSNVTSHGISYAVIDSSANLVHSSQAIETNISTGLQGQLRTTEDMAATVHANGVDIWITFHPLFSKHVVSYLLTCEGFVTQPVVSGEGLVPFVDIHEGIGGLDFTQDGSKLAVGAEIYVTGPQDDSYNAYGTINLYDFDNSTGMISNRMAIYPQQWSSSQLYNLVFGPEGKWLHYSGGSQKGKLDISSNNEITIRGTYQVSAELSSPNGFNGASITYAGQLANSNTIYTGSGLASRFSSNSIYIPPSEEPDIVEVGPFCSTKDTVVDLHTYWSCAVVSAEDTINQRHSYFLLDSNDVTGLTIDVNSNAVIGEKTGYFNPSLAGKGIHKIVFAYCGVNDTINITVNDTSCSNGGTVKTLSINENELVIYPNPTTGKIWFSNGATTSWKLYTVYGKLIQEGISNSVNLQHFSKGNYVLRTEENYTIVVRH